MPTTFTEGVYFAEVSFLISVPLAAFSEVLLYHWYVIVLPVFVLASTINGTTPSWSFAYVAPTGSVTIVSVGLLTVTVAMFE